MGTGREAALTALTACRRLDAWSDGSLKAACRELDRREAALAEQPACKLRVFPFCQHDPQRLLL